MSTVTNIIAELQTEGRDDIDPSMVANIAVPDGCLPDDHPDYLTDRDPWSVAWDEAQAALRAR